MKRTWQKAIKHRTFWELGVLLTIFTGGFIWFFWESLWTLPDQNTIHNLILLTAGIVGWYFLSRRTKAAEQDAQAAQRNAQAVEQGLTVERLTHAIDQLTSEKSFVRLGGILGLGRIAGTHEEEHKTIARVLVSFIRKRATINSKEIKEDLATYENSESEIERNFSASRTPRLDVEAAVNTLANIASKLEEKGQFREQYNEQKTNLCDLQDIDLSDLRFVESDLSKFDFTEANLSRAWMAGANLTDAHLCKYDSLVMKIFSAKLIDTFLNDANLSGARLCSVDLSDAQLERAKFIKAHLHEAVLIDANISRADFEGAVGLTQEQINQAFCWKGEEPINLPDKLRPPPARRKPV